MFSQGREVFSSRRRFCFPAVSGIINEPTIIGRLKLVPRNAATSLGALFQWWRHKAVLRKVTFFNALLIHCVLI